mmetsp:Transcript_36050/g.102057  ORF Transcript_36050/g.102057 Transcript_36050/m.102057 type:complete len:190 (-) Transcript_36050:99-668(-)|eukprot:CAMPEP_0117663294 /NCGR_PEP_ID=MMETSP0804-20121206/8525_1 /TAXON_ID=1074897 /ORGANISM="Tetraselmis astigmatica, Strain CCMP880" /LENGTH=189 /DNA_ID=CAMNT_0005470281 /DNA_START=69 /DNA_END=638 /DNA_ORIENTATION=+
MAALTTAMSRLSVGTVQPRPAARSARLAPPRAVSLSAAAPATFDGLAVSNRLGLDSAAVSPLESVSNGATVFAMRHRKKLARLNRPADQRKALIRGLVTDVLKYGSITTTKPRAKAIRKYVDHMVTLSKRGGLHARRQALAFIYDKEVVASLFEEGPDRYGERPGGYCRVVNELPRRGDNAPMARIEMV